MSFHTVMTGFHYLMALMGLFMSGNTALLLVLTKCGKEATHMQPLYCGGGVGFFLLFGAYQGLRVDGELPDWLQPAHGR